MLIQKHCRIGNEVVVQGKQGVVMEISDKVKVKFHDGTYGFVPEDMVEVKVDGDSRMDSRLKGFVPSHPDIPTAESPHPGTNGPSTSTTAEMISQTKPKTPSCPFCGNEARPIGMDFEQKNAVPMQCMSCSQRYTSEIAIKSNVYAESFNSQDNLLLM